MEEDQTDNILDLDGSSSRRRSSSGQALKRARAKFLVRHILPSDNHAFVGRIYDLSIVAYHFESYEELRLHADCKYAFDVNGELSVLTRRVESLNLVGDLIWPTSMPPNFRDFPVARYEWLTVATDVFLMRYISVVDCALLLTNVIYEAELKPNKCSIDAMRKRGVPAKTLAILDEMQRDQGKLRAERNARVHHGLERPFTQDDQTFRTASLFERINGVTGTDRYGRKINLDRMYREALVEVQRDFNRVTPAPRTHARHALR